jgi:HAD superfamily hydrolase (TIGR01549 family)
VKLVMFDMDGTLYRTETSFFPAVQEFAVRHAFPVPDEQFLRGFIGQSGIEWRAWVEQLHLGQPIDELLEEFEILEKRFVQEQGRLYEGAADMLRGLVSDGWRLGICSNAPAWYPELILTGAGVHDLFSLVRVPRRHEETKSMMLCEVWNEFHLEQCAMVGDRADDMRAAHAAGFLAIGAVYGWAPEELDHADIRIHDISEVPTALARYGTAAEEPKVVPIMTAVNPPVEAPAPIAAVEPTAAQDIHEASIQEVIPAKPIQQETVPEPVQETPVAQTTATPPVQQPAPPLIPRPAPAAAESSEHPASAPARHFWNPFRRRDDRSR